MSRMNELLWWYAQKLCYLRLEKDDIRDLFSYSYVICLLWAFDMSTLSRYTY